MEQTLGKKIAANRKKLAMTQDQLAEKLGVTAQAVSKWENDQSCPDITMLPKLAEIFGTSTDSLLGCENVPVHQAEVVSDAEGQPEGLHINLQNNDGDRWVFKWDSGRQSALAFALMVLLVGGLTLVSRMYGWDASFWDILWPSALLVFGINGLFPKFSVFSLGCALFGGYSLLANLGIWQLDVSKELILPIIVLLFGLSLLIDALRKPTKPHFQVVHNRENQKKRNECTVDGESFDCSLSFGEDTQRITLPRLSGGDISVSFGELTVDLRECDDVAEGCTIDASCTFGELTLLVPRRFRVEHDSSTSFGSFEIKGQPDSQTTGTILLDASVSFGQINVRYI